MLIIKTQSFISHFAGNFIENDPILAQMPNVALAFHILNEAYDPKSFWKPYLDALPSSYDTVMYFTPDEISELKGSPTFGKRPFSSSSFPIKNKANSITYRFSKEDALKMCKNIARQYAYFYSLLQVITHKNEDTKKQQ